LVVVDPGVGGERKNLFIQTELGNFIGPDNGVLDWAVQDVVKRTQKEAAIYEIPVPEGVPPTFYGRDVFIPFLARYLAGHPQKLNRLENWKPEPFPICKKQKKTVRTQVIHVDKFGNGVLSLSPFEVENPKGEWKKKKLKVYSHYQAIPKGAVGLVSGSHGLWELAGASASAAKLLSFEKGDEVVLQMS
jgi:S-adenosylmethionine hydrolase